MSDKRKFEVHGKKGDQSMVVGCDDQKTAEDAAKGLERDGYSYVRIVEND